VCVNGLRAIGLIVSELRLPYLVVPLGDRKFERKP
jgi:hypothetical protein